MSRLLLLVMAVVLARAVSLQCPAGRQFWDSALQRCRDCSRCVPPAVVLRPCGVHRDALCGPIADLNIDWSWIDGRRRPDQLDIALLEDAPRPHHHHHHHWTPASSSSAEVVAPSTTTPGTYASPSARKHAHKGTEKTSSSPAASRRKRKKHKHSSLGEDPRQKAAHGRMKQRRKHGRPGDDQEKAPPPPSASFLKSDKRARRPEAASQVLARPGTPPPAPLPAPRETEKPFTAAESLVWDGQAFALALAVFACLFFFLVAAAYSIYQARHWRRLSTNFEADVEELSAQLSLVASGCVVVEPHPATPPPSPPGDVGGKTQCSYLEQLLACKQERERANVYIDRQSSVREPAAPPLSMKQ